MIKFGRAANILSWKPIYLYRKFIDIRAEKTNPNTISKSPKQSSEYRDSIKSNLSTNFAEKLTKSEHFKHETLKIGSLNFSDSHKQTQEEHELNLSIKNAEKESTLYFILRRKGHTMKVEQVLNVFDKVVELEAEERSLLIKDKIKTNNEERYDYLVDELKRVLLRSSYAPEVYVKFIYVMSRVKNEYIFNKLFSPIFIRILEKELQPELFQTSQTLPSETEESQLSQVLSVESNLKLVQSLLRIVNNKNNQISKEDTKVIVGLIRSIINYLHVPVTQSKISTNILLNLIGMYFGAYPQVKLTSTVIKNLSKELLSRIKNESLLKQVQNNENEQNFPEIHSVNTLRKLFLLEKLLSQQMKQSAMYREILETKENNLMHHPFIAVEHKISNFINEMLPKCRFHVKEREGPMEDSSHIWQHIELISELTEHVKLVFGKTPIEVLAKCDILSKTYSEFESIIKYLRKFNQHLANVFLIEDLTFKESYNYWRLVTSSNNLLYLLLSHEVQARIPQGFAQTVIEKEFIKPAIKNFTILVPETQIMVIWYLCQQEDVADELANLVRLFINSKSNNFKLIGSQYKRSYYFWYCQLLLGNKKYISCIGQELKAKEIENAWVAVKNIILEIKDSCLQLGLEEHSEKDVCNELCKNIASHFCELSHVSQKLEELLSSYRSKSITNCTFTENEIEKLKVHSQKFSLSKIEQSYGKNFEREVKQNIITRLDEMFARTELMYDLLNNLLENGEQKERFMKELSQIYSNEYTLLKYPALFSPKNIKTIKKLEGLLLKISGGNIVEKI